MEKGNEGDEILLLSLKQIGCNIPKELQTIGQFTPELLIHIISKVLLLVSSGQTQCPEKLPVNIAVRHRICTEVSSKIKDLGYSQECGYNQLLYPVEHQTRDLIKWLVEKIPRNIEEDMEEPLSGANSLHRSNMQGFSSWQASLWKLSLLCKASGSTARLLPAMCFPTENENMVTSLHWRNTREKLVEAKKTDAINRKFLETQKNNGSAPKRPLQSQDFYSAIHSNKNDRKYEANEDNSSNKRSTDLALSFQELVQTITDSQIPDGSHNYRNSRFANATVFAQEENVDTSRRVINAAISVDTFDSSTDKANGTSGKSFMSSAPLSASTLSTPISAEYDEQKRQEELKTIRTDITYLNIEVERKFGREMELNDSVTNFELILEKLQKDTDSLEKECLVKKRVLEMIPTAVESISKLRSICDKNNEKLNNLESEWMGVKLPLEEKISRLSAIKYQRISRVSEMISEIKEHRESMIPMVKNLKEQQERIVLLNEEKLKLPKNLNRTLYTHRILDITASIAKQNKEIEKITTDIRDIQKLINQSSTTLQRADAVAEELIFKAASDKNDPVMIDTYRRLRMLRSNFENVIQVVNNVGNSEKMYRDLETKIDQEKARLATYNYERIRIDLESIVKENSSILQRIKELSR